MLVHRRVTPSIKFAGTHLYTWVERDTVRVKCLAQEHNAMTPVRARPGDERTNHEATAAKFSLILNGLNRSRDAIMFVRGETLSAIIVHH